MSMICIVITLFHLFSIPVRVLMFFSLVEDKILISKNSVELAYVIVDFIH